MLLVLGITWAVRAVEHEHADAALLRADPETVLADPALGSVALGSGRAVFIRRCAACHGDASHRRRPGVPDLGGGGRLYGDGSVAEVETIAAHGIRSGDPRGWHLAAMPAYASEHPYSREPIPPLDPRELGDVTQFVLGLTGRATDARARARGATVYAGKGGCWDCHGADAKGETAIGAPDLTDRQWVYGGSADDIYRSIARGRAGVCPAFKRSLDPAALRAVAVYVASLRPEARR